MGPPAPQFTLLPVPADGIPTNAALVASVVGFQWNVAVTSGGRALVVEQATLPSLGPTGSFGQYLAIRSKKAWPAGATLEVQGHELLGGRTSVKVAAAPCKTPPTCDWKGPIAHEPVPDALPPPPPATNQPYMPPPHMVRIFKIPPIVSAAGYVVSLRACLEANDVRLIEEGYVPTSTRELRLARAHAERWPASIRLLGLVMTDLAGNSATIGKTW